MSTPRIFRKKAAEVQAMQWDGTAAGATPIINWLLASGSTATYLCSDTIRCSENNGDCPHWISFSTSGLHAPQIAHLGCWIVRGADGEFYQSKPDIFEQMYDEVEGHQS